MKAEHDFGVQVVRVNLPNEPLDTPRTAAVRAGAGPLGRRSSIRLGRAQPIPSSESGLLPPATPSSQLSPLRTKRARRSNNRRQPSPKAGQGHLHFQMDKGKFDFPKYSGANGQLAVKLGVAGTYSPAVKPTITYRNLPKGKHMSRSTSPATITRTARARRSSSPSASTGTREAEASLAGEASAHPNALRCLCSRRAYLQFLAPHQGDRCK